MNKFYGLIVLLLLCSQSLIAQDAPAIDLDAEVEEVETERFKLGSDGNYIFVEEMPRFPNVACEKETDKSWRKECADRAFLKFLKEELVYPQAAIDNNKEGFVFMTFIVSIDGSVENPKVGLDIGDGCGAAALNVIKLMQEREMKWIPGKHKGELVPVRYNIPVRFELPK